MISRKTAAYPQSRALPPPPVDLTDRAVRERLSRSGAAGVLQHHGALDGA